MDSKMYQSRLHRTSGLVHDDLLLLVSEEGRKVGIGQQLPFRIYCIHPSFCLSKEFNIKIIKSQWNPIWWPNFTLGKFGHLHLTFLICKLKTVTSVPYRDLIVTNGIIYMKTYSSEETSFNYHNLREHRNQLVFTKMCYFFRLLSIEFLPGMWI